MEISVHQNTAELVQAIRMIDEAHTKAVEALQEAFGQTRAEILDDDYLFQDFGKAKEAVKEVMAMVISQNIDEYRNVI